MKCFYKQIYNKDHQYFKLFQFLFEHNEKYRKNQNEEKSLYDNYGHKYYNKPIIIEHYIKEDTSFTNNSKMTNLNSKLKDEFGSNFNCELNNSKSNDGKLNNEYLDENNKKVFVYRKLDSSTQKSKINSYTIRNRSWSSKNINKSKKKLRKSQAIHSSLIFDDNKKHFYFNKSNNNLLDKKPFYSTNLKGNKNNINLYLMPKRISQKLRNEYINKIKHKNDNKKNRIRSATINKNTTDKLSLSIFYEYKNKMNESLVKDKNTYNDMKQINRFRQIKKELSEERAKINNMMSEFFKHPLYNKFNHKDSILEMLKQKNHINRPRSAIS